MIPFNQSSITEKEKEYIMQSLDSNKICGDGNYTQKVNRFIEEYFNVKKALLTTSCTHALEMASLLIDLKSGDEVILPSYTFVSTANPILLRGAKPIFCDIDPQTLNINAENIIKKITSKTKAIFIVHYAGVSCDMDAIMELAERHSLYIIEDAAQGVNAKYKGKYLGTIGHFGAYSYHETKNYVCGEGGSILINTDDEKVWQKSEILREKGTNRSMFYRGEVDKYSWKDIGSSYLPSDILAAMLYAQFERLDEIQEKREQIYNNYYRGLTELGDKEIFRLPQIPNYAKSNYHMFYILCQDEEMRNMLMNKLKEKGIQAVFHYLPLHTSDMGKVLGYREGDLPVTENVSRRLLRLPMYADLSKTDQEYIIACIYDIINQKKENVINVQNIV